MKKIGLLLLISCVLFSCKSKSKVVTEKSKSKPKTYTYTTKNPPKHKPTPKSSPVIVSSSNENSSKDADKVVRKALSFKGTRYKYGGTSKSGMDCSGLMFTSFKSINVNLPRTSIDQSRKGIAISNAKIKKGDLLFFKTSRKNRINHVGLVVSAKGRDVKFIHSSTSRGVMISSLKEGYWSSAYVKARRVLTNQTTTNETNTTNSTTKHYTVKKGDTLYGIARKYNGVSANDIISHNNLKSTNLRPGMVLKIPSI